MVKLRTLLIPTLLTACQPESHVNQDVMNLARTLLCVGTETPGPTQISTYYEYHINPYFSELTEKYQKIDITFSDSNGTEYADFDDSLTLAISNDNANPAEEWYNPHLDGFSTETEINWSEPPTEQTDANYLYLTVFSPSHQRFTDLEENPSKTFTRWMKEISTKLAELNSNTKCYFATYDTGYLPS
jgi:hypothetical protein